MLIVGGMQTASTPVASAASPTLTLSPISGLSGSSVTVTGANFPINTSVSLKWDSSSTLGSATTGTGGRFSKTVKIPTASVGNHSVKAVSGVASARATFQVTAATSTTPTPVASSGGVQILVPSYYESSSSSDWTALANAGASKVPYALFAPHSGPGTSQEQAWVTVRNQLKAAGIKAIAYIDTNDATTPVSQVESAIDSYEAWYQPDGVFLDNAGQSASNVQYLTTIRDYMRSKMQRTTTLVLNVGIWPDQSYANVADIMNLQGTYADWSTLGTPPAWVTTLPATRFSVMVTNATSTQMQSVYSSASAEHVGYVYAEDSANGLTYQHVPTYWSQEVSMATTQVVSVASSTTQMVVPSYYENNYTTDWNALFNAGSSVAPYALFAPHSGPGTAQEQGWVTVRNQMKAAGMKAIAYIDTDSTNIPLSQVEAEIDEYEAWYQPDGLFLDNANQSASSVPYLTTVRDYMRTKFQRTTTLVLNVGIWPDQSYASVGDILNLEATYADWSTRGAPPAWVTSLPSSRFSVMVVNATSTQMQSVYSTAKAQHVGYVYAEDSANGLTYQHVPTYWNQEVSTAEVTTR